MALSASPVHRAGSCAVVAMQDFGTSAEAAFALVCEVEKWPVWLSFLTSARVVEEGAAIALGTEIAIRGAIPGEPEEFYEVDQFLRGHVISLVGSYSLRRRIDFRIERKSQHSRLVVRVDYPSYGGALGAIVDRLTVRRRLDRDLVDSLVHFKGLVEFRSGADEILSDF